MGKHVGKAYDPALRESEAGSRLYNSWRKIRRHPHCDEWTDYQTFYEWALREGYKIGDWLVLLDPDKPYGPDNCKWHMAHYADPPPSDYTAWVYEWNVTVNRIRKHYGMPPLEGTNYGD